MFAAVLVVVMVVAELVALGHTWTERHVVCPEHGELVHAGAADAVGQPVLGEQAVLRAAPVPEPGRDEGHGEHEHCLALTCGQHVATVAAGGPGVWLADRAPDLWVSVRAPARVGGVALLHRAPKTSPPVA